MIGSLSIPGVKGLKGVANAPITNEEMEEEYCRVTGWPYPIREIVFVRSWMVMRVSARDFQFFFFFFLQERLMGLSSLR